MKYQVLMFTMRLKENIETPDTRTIIADISRKISDIELKADYIIEKLHWFRYRAKEIIDGNVTSEIEEEIMEDE